MIRKILGDLFFLFLFFSFFFLLNFIWLFYGIYVFAGAFIFFGFILSLIASKLSKKKTWIQLPKKEILRRYGSFLRSLWKNRKLSGLDSLIVIREVHSGKEKLILGKKIFNAKLAKRGYD